MLRLTPTGPIWPYSDAQLRADEPATLFPSVLTAADRAAFGVVEPQPTNPPSYDPATERIEEAHPVLVGDAWTQAWAVVPLTPEEHDAYLQANKPAPDWLGFAGWLYGFGPIMDGMEAARASREPQGEPATTGLPTALDEARLRQNYVAFALSWGQFIAASRMAPEALTEIAAKATACHLPDEFIAALGA